MTDNTETRESIWERRVTVLLVSLLVAIGGWTALEVQGQASRVARIEERLASVSSQLQDMKIAMQERYTKSDAAKDFGVRDRQIADLIERVRQLERQGAK